MLPAVTVTGWLDAPRSDTGLQFLGDDGAWRLLTYAELAGRVGAMAEVLRDGGLAGRRLGLLAATSEDFVTQLFAIMVTGGTGVPVPKILPGQEPGAHRERVARVLELAKPDTVLVTPGDAVEDLGGQPVSSVPAFSSLDRAVDVSPVQSDAPALVQFSSGTGGTQKGVRISRRGLDGNVTAVRRWLQMTKDLDRGASWLPMSHDQGLIGSLLTPVALQGDMLLMTPLQFLLHPERWLRCFGELGCTVASAPSFGYVHVARKVPLDALEGCRFDGWRIAIVGAEPLRADDIDLFAHTFAPLGFRRRAFCPAYGLAESTLAVSGTPPDRDPIVLADVTADEASGASDGRVLVTLKQETLPRDQIVSSGVPLDGVQISVRLPDGTEAPDGAVGEIWVAGASLADGYEPGEDFGEWLATGDVGCVRGGELFVFGRLADSFKIMGSLVLAEQAEKAIEQTVPTAGSLVVVPSRTEAAGVTVIVESGQPWSPEQAEEARQAIVSLLRNTEVDLLVVLPGSIPRTPSGKPRRRECWVTFVVGAGPA